MKLYEKSKLTAEDFCGQYRPAFLENCDIYNQVVFLLFFPNYMQSVFIEKRHTMSSDSFDVDVLEDPVTREIPVVQVSKYRKYHYSFTDTFERKELLNKNANELIPHEGNQNEFVIAGMPLSQLNAESLVGRMNVRDDIEIEGKDRSRNVIIEDKIWQDIYESDVINEVIAKWGFPVDDFSTKNLFDFLIEVLLKKSNEINAGACEITSIAINNAADEFRWVTRKSSGIPIRSSNITGIKTLRIRHKSSKGILLPTTLCMACYKPLVIKYGIEKISHYCSKRSNYRCWNSRRK